VLNRSAGRKISDTVTTLGAGVDGSVRRIDTAYNPQGLAYLFTSYADTAGTQIVNQVENIYTGLGQVAFQYQALTGAVDVITTPVVQYTYSSPSNGSRLTSMVYPNGRTINYDYGSDLTNTNAALDNAIGRLDAIVDGANSGDVGTVLEQYSYLGLSTIVARNHPQTDINLTYVGTSGSIGSGGDQYVGLDQFGRVVDQNWVDTSTGQSTDNFTYSYDANSNVAAENNLLDTAYSQTFTYDPLNRLASNTLGGAANQSWTLDSQGNWSSFTSNGTTQTRTANAQNQITSISGTTGTPVYDANGNMTTDQNGNTLVYNAWNQLVAVKNSTGQVIAQYAYNAMGYRITEAYPQGGTGIPAGTVNYIYYDTNWQAIETRTNGTAASNVSSQMVWSAAYINAAILQDTYTGGVIQPNARLYYLQDANWNTTAIVGLANGSWQVTQRYVYSPYGSITVLNANWTTPPSGTQPAVDNLYQGMSLDQVTGLYYARNRNYDPALGRWINQDPAGYINGANTYQFVMSNPVVNVDPWGLWSLWNIFSWPIWHSVPANAAKEAAGHAVGGGEFCGAAEALRPLAKPGIFANARLSYDLTHGIDFTEDPLYQGLYAIAGGTPWQYLSPAEQQAVQNWSQNAMK
jgi:RHS repeat-associated protein